MITITKNYFMTIMKLIKAPLGACLAPAARVHVRTYAAVRRVGSGKRGDMFVTHRVLHKFKYLEY